MTIGCGHPSGTNVTICLKRSTRKKGGQPYIFPIRPCFGCGLPSQPVTRLLVSSYLAISPLPAFKQFKIFLNKINT